MSIIMHRFEYLKLNKPRYGPWMHKNMLVLSSAKS